MRDGVDLADIGEELVAEPFAFRGAAHQAGDIDEHQPGREISPIGERRQRPRRGSGTATLPTFGSIVQNG